jgi:hypothetical protein
MSRRAEVTDLGYHLNQANGQGEQGTRDLSCYEERGSRTMIDRAYFEGATTATLPTQD